MLARGGQAVLVVVVAALLGTYVENRAGLPQSTALGLIAPIVGAHTILFSPPGTRRAELISVIKLTGIAVAVYAFALLIDWGDRNSGDTVSQIAWVFVIAVGFYLRRFGPTGFRFGLMMSLMFMFVVILNPSPTDTAWWLPAAVLGGLSGALVTLLVWRPSATRAFFSQRDRFLVAVVDRLKVQQRPIEAAARPHSHGEVHRAWENLARSCDLAAGMKPAERPHLERDLAAALRMMLALELVADDPGGEMARAAPTSPLQQALADTINLLSVKSDPAVISDCVARMRKLRDTIVVETDKPGRERFNQARLIIGLLRIMLSFEEMSSDVGTRKDQGSTRHAASARGPANANALGLRLALQAAVAAGITTALGLAFNLEHAYWATLTVVIVIGANLGSTVRRTLERGLGTAIGVAAAIAIIWLTADNRTALTVVVALAALPITVTIERYYIVAAGLIGFTVVTGLHLIEGLTVAEMLSRVYETAIGAAVGLSVAWLLVPIRSADHVSTILLGFRNDCRIAIQNALAGTTHEAAAAGQLQKDTRDLAVELSNIQSERLLARGAGVGTQRLQAYADSLAIYVAMLATILERLAQTEVPAGNRALLTELVNVLSRSLGAAFDEASTATDIEDLTKRWIDATKLDGSIRAREAMWLIETLVYGRKCLETLEGLHHLLARDTAETRRRQA